MRVLLVNFIPSGGMSHYSQNLADALCGLCRLTVVAREDDPIVRIGRLSTCSYPADSRRGIRASAIKAAFFRRFAQDVCRELAPDVIHFTSAGLGLFPFLTVARRMKVATVVTVHDPVPHDECLSLRGRLVRYIGGKLEGPTIFCQSGRIHVHTRSLYDHLRARSVFAQRVYVAPHGVGIARSIVLGANSTQSDHEAASTEGPLKLLFFGRIEPYKGLDILLEALESLRGRTEVELTIAGAGNIPETVRTRLNALPLRPTVLNSFVDDSHIAGLFSRADVVVAPYRTATQSGVASLSLAFEKPVLASDTGGIRELVQPGVTGILVPPNDPQAFASGIIAMSNKLDRLRLQANIRACVSDRLEWGHVAPIHVFQYEEMLHCRTKSSSAQRHRVDWGNS